MGMKGKFKNFFNFDDEYEYTEMVEVEEEQSEQEQVSSKRGKDKNIVNLSAIQQASSKVVLCEPKSYDEAQEIADHLITKRSVIINLQRVDSDQAKRIVDFLSGTVYAVNGDIQKLGIATFLCTPENVDVTGEISKSQDGDAFYEGW